MYVHKTSSPFVFVTHRLITVFFHELLKCYLMTLCFSTNICVLHISFYETNISTIFTFIGLVCMEHHIIQLTFSGYKHTLCTCRIYDFRGMSNVMLDKRKKYPTTPKCSNHSHTPFGLTQLTDVI